MMGNHHSSGAARPDLTRPVSLHTLFLPSTVSLSVKRSSSSMKNKSKTMSSNPELNSGQRNQQNIIHTLLTVTTCVLWRMVCGLKGDTLWFKKEIFHMSSCGSYKWVFYTAVKRLLLSTTFVVSLFNGYSFTIQPRQACSSHNNLDLQNRISKEQDSWRLYLIQPSCCKIGFPAQYVIMPRYWSKKFRFSCHSLPIPV